MSHAAFIRNFNELALDILEHTCYTKYNGKGRAYAVYKGRASGPGLVLGGAFCINFVYFLRSSSKFVFAKSSSR